MSSSTLVAGALLLLLLVLVLKAGGEDEKDTLVKESPIDAQEPEGIEEVEVRLGNDPEQAVGITESDFAENSELSRERALAKFTEALAGKRLWASVDGVPEGSSVDIISASCGDATMKQEITSAAGLLRKVEIRHLRCLEKHGALVFEQEL